MDPNETLKALRDDIIAWEADNDPYDALLIVERIKALDTWMANGGFLPEAWNVKTAFDLRR